MPLYLRSLALFRTIGSTYHVANTLDGVGRAVPGPLGQNDQAHEVWQEALELYREGGQIPARAPVDARWRVRGARPASAVATSTAPPPHTAHPPGSAPDTTRTPSGRLHRPPRPAPTTRPATIECDHATGSASPGSTRPSPHRDRSRRDRSCVHIQAHTRTLGKHRGLPQLSERPSRRPLPGNPRMLVSEAPARNHSPQAVTSYRV